jgi:hypothetical protein
MSTCILQVITLLIFLTSGLSLSWGPDACSLFECSPCILTETQNCSSPLSNGPPSSQVPSLGIAAAIAFCLGCLSTSANILLSVQYTRNARVWQRRSWLRWVANVSGASTDQLRVVFYLALPSSLLVN